MEERTGTLRSMRICRFCLSDEIDLTNIYEKNAKDKQSVPLPLQIMACIAIEVFSNDGMPQFICTKCRKLTLQAYAFKTNAKKADDALKLFLATGELNKPHLAPILIKQSEIPNPEKNLSNIAKHASPPSIKEEPPKKLARLEKPEVITLNFDQNSGEQIVENVDEEIDGEANIEGEMHEVEQEDYVEEAAEKAMAPVKTDIFPCSQCERTFPLKQLLDLHVVNHDRERHFKCDKCDRKFFTKYDLNTHNQTHVDDKPYVCIVCHKTFSRASLLQRHEKIHVDVPKYVCGECQRPFLTQVNLDSHMEKHRKKRPFVCNICNKSFVFKQGLERHEMVHSENKPHKCNYCEASFNSAIKLTRHITTHAGLRPYPCKLCGRTFLMSHHLTRHMRSHYAVMSAQPEKSIGEYKCDICSMSFRRKDFLINHSAIHSMVNLRCVICNTKFENAKEVKEHITTHLSDLPFPCDKCDYSFESQDQLEEHELKHAEMEYEVQIEQEVLAEAKQGGDDDRYLDSDYEGEAEIDEFTLTNDINNPDILRRTKSKPTNIVQFLKDELISDEEEGGDQEHVMEMEDEEPEIDEIKPIVRSEGTKVYSRKKDQSLNRPMSTDQVEIIPLNDSNVLNGSINMSQEPINVANRKTFNMKLSEKVVRVQKYILTKEEMKAMAKKGIIEMKGNTVLVKNPGQPILNATLKPIAPGDLEAMIDNSKQKSFHQKIEPHFGLPESSDVNMSFEETGEVDVMPIIS